MSSRNKSWAFIWFFVINLLCSSWLYGASINDDQKPRIAFSISAGSSMIDGGDLNLMAREMKALLSNPAVRDYDPHVVWNEKKWLPYLEFDFFYYPARRLALSLGVEYGAYKSSVHRGPEGFMWYFDSGTISETDEYLITNESEMLNEFRFGLIRDIGLSLRAHFTISLGNDFQAYISGGPTLHFSRVNPGYTSYKYDTIYTYRKEPTGNPNEYYLILESTEDVITTDYKENSGKSVFPGFKVGAGLEIKLSDKHYLWVGTDYRLAVSKNWKGQMQHSFRSQHETIEGKYYYSTWQYIGPTPINYVAISSIPDANSRKANINFSGIVLTVGYRLKL